MKKNRYIVRRAYIIIDTEDDNEIVGTYSNRRTARKMAEEFQEEDELEEMCNHLFAIVEQNEKYEQYEELAKQYREIYGDEDDDEEE